MPIDLAEILAPRRCAVVVFECQQRLLGEGTPLPGLRAAAEATGLLENLAGLLRRGRKAGVPVVYVRVVPPPPGEASRMHSPLEARVGPRGGGEAPHGFDAGPICKEVAPCDGDIVVERPHGMTGFYRSDLDSVLRAFGAETLVLAGISLNIGVLGTAIEAVNRGYRVVIPQDCVAADPPEYKDPILRYSLRNLAYLSDAEAIAEHFEGALA